MDVQDCDEEAARKELAVIAKESQISADMTDLLTLKGDE